MYSATFGYLGDLTEPCPRFYTDTISESLMTECKDPKHNTNSNTDIEKVEEEEGKVTRPANPNLNQQQASTISQRCSSIQ